MSEAVAAVRARRRRRWPWFVLAVIAVFGIAVWRVAHDSGRLTAFLQSQARDRFALEIELTRPAQFDFFPVLALRLDGVRAHASGSPRTLFTADALSARIPWRALWSGTITIDGLEVMRPTIHAQPLAEWFAIVSPATDGPPAPLRWPAIASDFVVRDATLIGADDAALAGPFDLAFDAMATDQPWRPTIAWRTATHAFSVRPEAIIRDTPSGLALDSLTAPIVARALAGDAGDETLTLAGRIAFDSAAAWSVDLRVASAHWPTWWPAWPTALAGGGAAASDASDFTLRLVSGGAAAMAIVADGTLAGTPVRASLVGDALPDFSKPLPALLEDVARDWRGSATVPALRVGDVAIEGLTIEAGIADEATGPPATPPDATPAAASARKPAAQPSPTTPRASPPSPPSP